MLLKLNLPYTDTLKYNIRFLGANSKLHGVHNFGNRECPALRGFTAVCTRETCEIATIVFPIHSFSQSSAVSAPRRHARPAGSYSMVLFARSASILIVLNIIIPSTKREWYSLPPIGCVGGGSICCGTDGLFDMIYKITIIWYTICACRDDALSLEMAAAAAAAVGVSYSVEMIIIMRIGRISHRV